jgi:hypothetical protein
LARLRSWVDPFSPTPKTGNTHEVREIEQEIRTLQGLVGGYIEAVTAQHCILWYDEDGGYKERPCNILATYLWWFMMCYRSSAPVGTLT